MSHRRYVFATGVLSLMALAPGRPATAADLPPPPAKAIPFLDVPFFSLIDNRLTYAYEPRAMSPGNIAPGGKSVLAFTHFDIWAYGTNYINVGMGKSTANDPAGPCSLPTQGCGGSTEFFGQIKSTLGFNQLFDTHAFSVGPLTNVSLAVGAGEGIKNISSAIDRKYLTAGVQFAFALPYKGYINFTPQVYKGWQYTSFYTAAAFAPAFPGVPGGWLDYNATWSVDVNYYMNLGFLPESVPLAISGFAVWIGPLSNGVAANALPAILLARTKTELYSEPIRLTLDASKAVWGPKYSHLTDVWIAYRYQRNILGLDNDTNPGCARNSCLVSSLYTGVTIKF
ncbi:hypothetical protein UP10_36725 [Bradyrhizobium sp. LTSPM299]|nr:hypothetical protein UP10_36725 [Bradyrhizobium sp. LTSPM299]